MDTQTLLTIKADDVQKFSLKDMIFDAKVVKVYDGDTITVIFHFNGRFYKWNCRLERIDTPEIKSKHIAEKNSAKHARDFLSDRILNKIVKIKCNMFDKYGRLLIELFMDNVNMNDLMISEGYAKEYDGGTKTEWNEE